MVLQQVFSKVSDVIDLTQSTYNMKYRVSMSQEGRVQKYTELQEEVVEPMEEGGHEEDAERMEAQSPNGREDHECQD